MSVTCEHCEGRGWWRSGCDGDVECYECHGTGVGRVQGNCELCRGWGWAITSEPCTACDATGSVPLPVALYWCTDCLRTVAAPLAAPACPRDAAHVLELRTGRRAI